MLASKPLVRFTTRNWRKMFDYSMKTDNCTQPKAFHRQGLLHKTEANEGKAQEFRRDTKGGFLCSDFLHFWGIQIPLNGYGINARQKSALCSKVSKNFHPYQNNCPQQVHWLTAHHTEKFQTPSSTKLHSGVCNPDDTRFFRPWKTRSKMGKPADENSHINTQKQWIAESYK